MDIKMVGTVIAAIGLTMFVGSGIFYTVNMDREVNSGVAFMAGVGNKQAQELWDKQENREIAKTGFIPGVIFTIAGIGIYISSKGSNSKA